MSYVVTARAIAYGTAAAKYAEEKCLKERDQDGKIINLIPVAEDFERHGLYSDDAKENLTEMARWTTRNGHGNIKNQFFWISFSPSADVIEQLNTPSETQSVHDKWKEAHDNWLIFMGLNNCQRLTIMHHGADGDPERPHLHDIINRTDLDGNLVSDSFLANRAIQAANRLSELYGQKTAAQIGKERKAEIKEKMHRALKSLASYSFQGFKEACASQGIELHEVMNGKAQQMQGYNVVLSAHDSTMYKASDIDRNLTLKRIENLWRKLRQQAIKEEQARRNNELKKTENGTKQIQKPMAEHSTEQHERDPKLTGWERAFRERQEPGHEEPTRRGFHR